MELARPLFGDILKAVWVVDGEAEQQDIGVRVGERTQAVVVLLAGRVPQSQLHLRVSNLEYIGWLSDITQEWDTVYNGCHASDRVVTKTHVGNKGTVDMLFKIASSSYPGKKNLVLLISGFSPNVLGLTLTVAAAVVVLVIVVVVVEVDVMHVVRL